MSHRTFVVLSILLALAGTAFGQSAALQGVVTDVQGSVIAGAKVTAMDDAKALVARSSSTGSDGAFELGQLQPGTYSIKVEMKGFKALERRGIVLDLSQVLSLGTLALEVGAVTDSVTVDASAPLVETTTGQFAYVVDDRQVNELSLNGRDFQNLMKTLPGVVSNDLSDFRLSFNNTNNWNTNGLRGSMNN